VSNSWFRRAAIAAAALVGLTTSTLLPASAAPPAHRGQGEAATPAERGQATAAQARERKPTVKVGAASRSVLPYVDGALDYLAAVPGPEDATSPGVFVEAFDDGRVAVGNGDRDAHWVRDDVRVRAVAVEELGGDGDLVVLVAADLYMIFRPDADAIRELIRDRLPADLRDRVDIAIGVTHNHHGPDTAFDINHTWYRSMMERTADAVVEAIDARRPATLRVADGEMWWGMRDSRDPAILDPTMNVLQATATNGAPIATLVQWNNHPEVTLGWTPTADTSADCAALGESAPCTRNRYYTADFTGWMSRTIESEVGGVAPVFVGALGGLVTPLRATLWEVDEEVGLGNQFDPPPGARPVGGASDFTEANFRRAYVLGREAARYALSLLDDGETITAAPLDYRSVDVLTRLSNIGFRFLLSVDPATGRTALGHTPAELWTCPPGGPKTEATCEPDGFASAFDPNIGGQVRVGDHFRTEVAYLTLGPIGMLFMPGEVVGEMVVGLPAGFDETPERWFSGSTSLHASGADYDTGGYLLDLMPERYRWTIGLGNDELGYIVPIADWRIRCIAGAACAQLHAGGFIAYPDSLSGEQCKRLADDPSTISDYPQSVWEAIVGSCTYGQALGQADSHYEETNSAGWDLAEDLLDATSRLTGVERTGQRINPDFPGYWAGFPPPA
jgi:hypothetical protein